MIEIAILIGVFIIGLIGGYCLRKPKPEYVDPMEEIDREIARQEGERWK